MGLNDCLNLCAPATAVLADCASKCFVAAGWEEPSSVPGSVHLPAYAALLLSAVLVGFSGVFSGLTLGLLSLDQVGLRILVEAGEPDEKKYANIILPGLLGLVVSTFVILILGEIIPQAACSRHSLRVGATAIPLVKFFILLFYPITKPISWCLDKALGHDIGTLYSQEELKRLIKIHAEDPTAQKECGLTADDHRMITGVFEYKGKKVSDCMTKLENCFMLEKSMKLNFQTLSKIYISGCSRIPIYEGDRNNIIGILFVKDLILVDPDDELEISTVMAFRGRTVGRMYDNVTLDKVFMKFITSSNHMLIAHAAPDQMGEGDTGPVTQTTVTGLITLEDVLEEMINFEIYDESDAADQMMSERRKGQHSRTHRQDVSIYLNLFEHKMKGSKLSQPEVQAIYAFLAFNMEEFRSLASSDVAFRGLVRTAEVLERVDPLDMDGHSVSAVSVEDYGDKFWELSMQTGQMLYQRGVPSPYFTLILQGKVLIRTGEEGFELELGPWNHLGNKALVLEHYVPDFDAIALPPTRALRIHRGSYLAAFDASRLEQAREFQAVKQHVRMAAQGAGGSMADLPAATAGAAGGPQASQAPAPGGAWSVNKLWNGSGPWDRRDHRDQRATSNAPPRNAIAALELARMSAGTSTPMELEVEDYEHDGHEAPEQARNHKGFNPQALDSFERRHLLPRPIGKRPATSDGLDGASPREGMQVDGSQASLSDLMTYTEGSKGGQGCLARHGSGELMDNASEASEPAAEAGRHYSNGKPIVEVLPSRMLSKHNSLTTYHGEPPEITPHDGGRSHGHTRISWDEHTMSGSGRYDSSHRPSAHHATGHGRHDPHHSLRTSVGSMHDPHHHATPSRTVLTSYDSGHLSVPPPQQQQRSGLAAFRSLSLNTSGGGGGYHPLSTNGQTSPTRQAPPRHPDHSSSSNGRQAKHSTARPKVHDIEKGLFDDLMPQQGASAHSSHGTHSMPTLHEGLSHGAHHSHTSHSHSIGRSTSHSSSEGHSSAHHSHQGGSRQAPVPNLHHGSDHAIPPIPPPPSLPRHTTPSAAHTPYGSSPDAAFMSPLDGLFSSPFAQGPISNGLPLPPGAKGSDGLHVGSPPFAAAHPSPPRSASLGRKEEAARTGLRDMLEAALGAVEGEREDPARVHKEDEGVMPLLEARTRRN